MHVCSSPCLADRPGSKPLKLQLPVATESLRHPGLQLTPAAQLGYAAPTWPCRNEAGAPALTQHCDAWLASSTVQLPPICSTPHEPNTRHDSNRLGCTITITSNGAMHATIICLRCCICPGSANGCAGSMHQAAALGHPIAVRPAPGCPITTS